VVVPDVAHRLAHERRDVDVGGRGHLARHHHEAGGQQRLAGDTTRGITREDGVEDGIRDLVRHFVRVPLGDRFRGEGGSHVVLRFSLWWTITLSNMAFATASLEVSGTSVVLPSASRITTAFVSWSNPAPGALTSLTTSRSTPLRASFRRPRSS